MKVMKMPKKKPSTPEPPALDHIVEGLRPLAEPMEKLVIDPANARKHDEANLQAIGSSLRQFGQRLPLVVNRKNDQIEKGNGTYRAAQKLGWTHIAVLWVEDDPASQTGFAIADNRTAELSSWDDAMLQTALVQLEQSTPALFDDLLLSELAPAAEGPVKHRTIDTQPPPALSWVLVGIPTVRFAEIADTVDRLGQIDGLILEMTSNSGPQAD